MQRILASLIRQLSHISMPSSTFFSMSTHLAGSRGTASSVKELILLFIEWSGDNILLQPNTLSAHHTKESWEKVRPFYWTSNESIHTGQTKERPLIVAAPLFVLDECFFSFLDKKWIHTGQTKEIPLIAPTLFFVLVSVSSVSWTKNESILNKLREEFLLCAGQVRPLFRCILSRIGWLNKCRKLTPAFFIRLLTLGLINFGDNLSFSFNAKLSPLNR